ncbi:hypothetical protein [Streptomyces apocyni]|uniref:hypothetical protein n=1 Tax=Streptomyces apocyni TaxID=2654677 RepID=UPI0012E9D3AA|nr:hypothetical protein [Streptomyces apocyni]
MSKHSSKHAKPNTGSGNIRRSIVIAAGATGMIALGAGAANATDLGKLPVSVPVSTPDVDDANTPETSDATDTADAAGRTGEAHTPEYDLPAIPGAPEVSTPDAEATVDAEVDYLFGPLADFAPQLVDEAPGHADDVARTAGPIVDETAYAVLPPLAVDAVQAVLPVVERAGGDATGLADGVAGDVTGSAVPFAQDATGEVKPYAGAVTGDAKDFAETVVAPVKPLAKGVGGNTTDLAQNVTGGAEPVAEGVVGTVTSDAEPLVENIATGTQGAVSSVTPSYVPSF